MWVDTGDSAREAAVMALDSGEFLTFLFLVREGEWGGLEESSF